MDPQAGTPAPTLLDSHEQPRPPLLDKNDTFDIVSKPFLVLGRLDALAYHMSIASPQWQESVDLPSVSVSNTTTEFVEEDKQCTTKPLQGPPLDFIHEVMGISIDFSTDSLLVLAMKKIDAIRFFPLWAYEEDDAQSIRS